MKLALSGSPLFWCHHSSKCFRLLGTIVLTLQIDQKPHLTAPFSSKCIPGPQCFWSIRVCYAATQELVAVPSALFRTYRYFICLKKICLVPFELPLEKVSIMHKCFVTLVNGERIYFYDFNNTCSRNCLWLLIFYKSFSFWTKGGDKTTFHFHLIHFVAIKLPLGCY